MEEQREESDFFGDFREPMEEAGNGRVLSSKTETLAEEATTVEASDSGVCDVDAPDANSDDGGSANEDGNTGNSVSVEKHVKADVGSVEAKDNVEKIVSPDDFETTEVERNNMECDVEAGEEESQETVTSAGDEVSDEKPNSGASDAEPNVQTENSQQSSVDGETLSDGKKEPTEKSEEDNDKMDVHSKQAKEEHEQENVGAETTDVKHSESAQVPEEYTQLSKGETGEEITNVNQKEENGEAMEIDYAAEELVENDVKVGGTLDNTGNESAGASVVQTRDIQIAEADGSDFNVAKEMEIDDRQENVDMATDLSGTIEPSDSADPNSPSEDAATGNIQDLKEKDHECLNKKAVDQQEAPSIEPNQKEDTDMEENPITSDYADDRADSDIRTNGVKRKADVLSEGSLGEGRKTVSFAKVSFVQRPSFKIGASIAKAASQMAGTPSALKGGNLDDETLAVESFVSQLHCAATDPDKENVVSEIAAGFLLDFRNSTASQQITPEMVSKKRGRPSNSTVGGTEAFDFEEMGDTYWTDRVIHNGGEEQTPPTEKRNYQVVPVELKPAQVKRTRRPYRRRQSQISVPLPSDSDKPANFDENAPAELIMNFSETDTIPPEKSLSKMFRCFGPIRESQTEVDKENNRARVVYRKSRDAQVAYNSAGRFSIFGTKAVNYELSFTITETFKVQPYVVSLGEEEVALSLPS
ncbi:hypothetical protein EUTSA_v10010166mg [Eutrema salsugineum]|uniref:Uncharacterized protein n=1 Tax=Eutrema salsugineum TaxID=72664 RepID=V4LRB6_EUTSA|nr:histone-lysine N-methyltransferase SETD1B isoform X2 [Eutrema salsugineum]ESQ44992.1 hypothetical protein EUTSA_v10010166mg [Eutrema salsugineum]